MKKLFLVSLALLTVISSSISVNAAQPVSSSSKSTAGSAVSGNPAAPVITAETAVLMDADNGAVLYGKDIHKKMYPASITKIMTGYLAIKYGKPDDVITVDQDALKNIKSDTTNIALRPGEKITQEQALYATFLASANDAASALAEHTGGTIENFVSMMNEQAKQWGALDTHFNNANGLPDANHYTSAYDMAVITQNALKVPEFLKYTGALSYTIPPTNLQPQSRPIQTLCKMLRNGKHYYPGIISAKSGWTTMSGSTLVTAARRNGITLICVLLKGPDNIAENAKLLNYGFDNYTKLSAAPVVAGYVSSAPSAVSSRPSENTAVVKNEETERPANTMPLDKVVLLAVIFSVFIFCLSVVILHRIRLRL